MKTYKLHLKGTTLEFNTDVKAMDKEHALKIAQSVYGYFNLVMCEEIK